MSLEKMFSAEDRDRIRAAVAGAEGTTSGEIVPYVVEGCDDYDEAAWLGAAVGAVTVAAVAAAIAFLVPLWGPTLWIWALLPASGGAVLGYGLTVWLAALRRRLIPADTLARRVEHRAQVAFLEEEVFDTRERTGILIFLALFEHRVVVLGDAGINSKVEQSEWQRIVDRAAEGIRRGQAADTLVQAIGECGRLLTERGVDLRPDDRNELADGLRFGDD